MMLSLLLICLTVFQAVVCEEESFALVSSFLFCVFLAVIENLFLQALRGERLHFLEIFPNFSRVIWISSKQTSPILCT